ncbi:hypothetical protein BGZ88_012040 [Linnemannia elongata]|nr:hypothetical protein BGZ88_012040 [Linnemannia elongata]
MQHRISPRTKATHPTAHRSSKDPSSAHQLVHPTDDPKITVAPRSPRDQTREQELILPKVDKGQQPMHDSLYSPEAPLHLLRAKPAHNNTPTASSDNGDDLDKKGRSHGGHFRNSGEDEEDDEEEDDDDSEYDEDSMDDEDESELDDSDIDDDDYSDSGNDHTDTESSTHMSSARDDPRRGTPISSETTLSHSATYNTNANTNNSNAVPLTTTPDLPSKGVHPISAQRAQQEVVKQLTLAAGAWNINPDSSNVQEPYRAEYSSTGSNTSSNSNNDRSISSTNATTHVRDNGMDERALMVETIRPRDERPLSSTTRRSPSRGHASALPPLPSTDTPTTRMSHRQQQQHLQQQNRQRIPDQSTTSSRSSASGSLSSPGNTSQVAKARMLPYVEDDAEDEDDYSGEDEDEDEDEDDYSYSEDEDEEDEEDEEDGDSSSEYHYGAKEDPANRTNKPRAPPPGQYNRSMYSHYRPPRLDENYLRKRAITKQVVRRSSLTALLGEVSQPAPAPLTLQAKNFTIHPTGSPLGQQVHQSAQVARRPGLTDVWPAPGPFTEPPSTQHQEEHNGLKPYSGSSDSGRTTSTASGLRPGSNLSEQNRRLMLGPNAAAAVLSQEPNRPRRTDSGVEVKSSQHQHRSSGSGSSDSRSSNEH